MARSSSYIDDVAAAKISCLDKLPAQVLDRKRALIPVIVLLHRFKFGTSNMVTQWNYACY